MWNKIIGNIILEIYVRVHIKYQIFIVMFFYTVLVYHGLGKKYVDNKIIFGYVFTLILVKLNN